MVKQLEPKRVTIGEVTFAIFPFGAFYAANLSGDLGKFLGPIVAGALPLLGSDSDVMELDLKEAMPLVIGAFEALDGDSVEKLLKKLLINQKNISCEYRDDKGEVVQSILSSDLADSIFCQNVYGMYRLAVEVINVNYSGFFKNLLGQYGNLKGILGTMTPGSTEDLTVVDSQILS